MTALELRAVTKRRGQGRHTILAIDAVSLRLEAGEVALLQGPSGSGKTTLLGLAAGLLTPDAGEVQLAGRWLGAEGSEGRRHLRGSRLGFVFQRANLLPGLSVRDNVLLQAALAGIARAEAAARADQILGALGLDGLATRLPATLSGGEEQRSAVARALVHRPALVLADEPTAMLDGTAGRAVAESLVALARERGAAVVIATHDPRLGGLASRLLRLADGRLVEDSCPSVSSRS